MESSQPSKSAYQSQSAFLFVGGLSLSASAKDVGQYFEQFGSIVKVDLPLSKSGQRKGFAFVHFGSQEGVGKALAIKVHIIRGKRVAVRRGMAGSDASQATREMQSRKIFASGFSKDASEEEVFRAVSAFGRVERILSPKGGIGQRGFCYIVMKDKAAFDHLCHLGQLEFGIDIITVGPAQLKSEIKENQTKSTGCSHHSASTGSNRFIQDQEFGLPNSQDSSSRSIPFEQHQRAIGGHHYERPTSMGNRRPTWYSPFSGIPQDSYHQFTDRITTRQSMMPTSWKSKFSQQAGVDVEIVQAISTTVTIRDSNGNTAIRASFDEQNTYSGIF